MKMADQQRILIVDDDPQNIKLAANALESVSNVIIGFAKSGEEALKRLEEVRYDLILLDVMMPGMDGFEVCSRLKVNAMTREIPVLFLTARVDEDSIEMAYDVGGVDYVSKPFKSRELVARVKQQLHRLEMTRDLEFLAHYDVLTGIYNRRRFFQLGRALIADRTSEPVAFIIDVDHFKQINHSYGHDAGDEVLKAVANRIGDMLPDDALFARMGGKEFAVLLSMKDVESALQLADSIRERIAEMIIPLSGGIDLKSTVSIGLSVNREIRSLDALLKMANEMLHNVKNEGDASITLEQQ